MVLGHTFEIGKNASYILRSAQILLRGSPSIQHESQHVQWAGGRYNLNNCVNTQYQLRPLHIL